MIANLVILLLKLLPFVPNIHAANADITAIDQSEWDNLSSSLSADASLQAVQTSDYDSTCRKLGTDAYAISNAANGICMHSHDCAYAFCLSKESVYDLPTYTVDVRTEEDISKVRMFVAHTAIAFVQSCNSCLGMVFIFQIGTRICNITLH